jgi:hypothetical protein
LVFWVCIDPSLGGVRLSEGKPYLTQTLAGS